MQGRQLSMWDNISLESGFRCLMAMDLDNAIQYFRNSLEKGSGDQKIIKLLIEVCQYWKNRIQSVHQTELSSESVEELLEDYNRFHFTPEMAGLEKALLMYIAEMVLKVQGICFGSIENAFDFLIRKKEYGTAEKIISQYMDGHPEERYSLYLLAQVQWMQLNHNEANISYARAFICCPGKTPLARIENKKLNDLILAYGNFLAPAYGWIKNILPFVQIPELIVTENAEHASALESYRLLQEAHRALKKNDMTSCINYRKQLKLHAPELYDEYFDLLKQRKSVNPFLMNPLSSPGS
ncbi:MAG: hypothetical protein KFF73_11190 [Cyclobacteriaceae bacterium]|nr:hypothetical protein [Cyclobacteriaceae bacterium]